MRIQSSFSLTRKIFVKCFFYITAFLIIFSGTVMWNYAPITGGHQRAILYLSMLFCLGSVAITVKDVCEKTVLTLAVFSFWILFFILVTNRDYKLHFIVYFAPFVVYLLLACELTRNGYMDDFLHAVSNVIIFFAAVSIVCWLLGSILGILPGRMQTTYFFAEEKHETFTYFYIYFENPIQAQSMFGQIITRNTGIVPEAPGYVSLLLYPFMLETLYFKNKSKMKISILIAAMITSFATKAIFLLMAFVFIKFVFSVKSGSVLKKIVKIAFAFVLLIGVCIASSIIMEDKSESGSYGIRADDLRSELLTWIDHPIFGIGLYNTDEIRQKFRVFRPNKGISLGIPSLLAQGGVYLLMLYVLPAVYFIFKKSSRENKEKVIIATVLAGIDFTISLLQTSPHFKFFIVFLYAKMVYSNVNVVSPSDRLKNYFNKIYHSKVQ